MTDLQVLALKAAHPFGAVFLPFQADVITPLVDAGLVETGAVSWIDNAQDFWLTDAGRAKLRELP